MALYEYECTECGNKEEKLINVDKSDSEQKCSKCGSILKRKISATSFRMNKI